MGTNFYFEPTEGPLAAYGKLHIGKRSGGWEFAFQAYEEYGGRRRLEVASSDLSIEVDLPRLVVKSYRDWLQLLRSTAGQIRDEYGTPYSLEGFEAEIAQVSPGKTWREGKPLLNHFEELKADQHRYGKVDPKRDWKDPQGFSFTLGAFC